MAQTQELKYEEALKRLEKIIEDLGKEGLELDARLRKFEEGTKLARLLLKRLEQAKKKVELLIKTQTGDLAVVPVDEAESEEKSSAQAP